VSERDGFRPGVPCWVASVHPDPEKAVDFYTELFGWEAEETMGIDSPGKYFMCTLRGRAVAAIGSLRGGGVPSVPAWGTHIWVESADEVAAKVVDEGGSVVAEAFDLLDAGRMAVVADPAGAVFGLWQPKEHRGAEVVNEPGAWAMSMLNTRDPEGAKTFYGEIFGWETDTFGAGDGEVTLWRLPNYVGGEPEQPVPRDVIGVMVPMSGDETPGDAPPYWSVNFWVDDADATADKAAKLGGMTIVPPFDTEISRDAVIADPQGAVFSVSTAPGP
jgi:predicted enzyme related to lactoylglutathione lyase